MVFVLYESEDLHDATGSESSRDHASDFAGLDCETEAPGASHTASGRPCHETLA
jgi:hypothetical protein